MKEQLYILCSNRPLETWDLAASKDGHMMCKKFERPNLVGKSSGHRAHSLLYIDIIRARIHFYTRPKYCSEHTSSNDYFLCTHLTSSIFLLPTAFCLLDWQKMIAAQPTTRWWLTTRYYYSKWCSAQLFVSFAWTEVVTYYDANQWYTIERNMKSSIFLSCMYVGIEYKWRDGCLLCPQGAWAFAVIVSLYGT